MSHPRLFTTIAAAVVALGSLPAHARPHAPKPPRDRPGSSASHAGFATVEVDLDDRVAVSSMTGFLHGTSSASFDLPQRVVRPLEPKIWRASPNGDYDSISQLGARFVLVLSDGWGYPGAGGWPFDDYSRWESYVRSVAVRYRDRNVIWDIWNEPDHPRFWGGSRAQYLETYTRAVRTIRSVVGDDAVVQGPGLARYDAGFIREFLDHARLEDLRIDVLSWHELSDTMVSTIDDRLVEARTAFVENPRYSKLGIEEIHISEYGGATEQYSPGPIVSYLYNLERGGADAAARACWPDSTGTTTCWNKTLNGLVTPTGARPRSGWWVYKAYAGGVPARVRASTSSDSIAALASHERGSASATILLGRVDGTAAEPVEIVLRDLPLEAFGTVHVHVERIPDTGEAPLSAPLPHARFSLLAHRRKATFSIDAAPGEAYLIEIDARAVVPRPE